MGAVLRSAYSIPHLPDAEVRATAALGFLLSEANLPAISPAIYGLIASDPILTKTRTSEPYEDADELEAGDLIR
jgi:hypothetical protein